MGQRYLALLRSECKGIESMQGSGSERDAVLYNTWFLGLDWRRDGRKGLRREEGDWEGKRGGGT